MSKAKKKSAKEASATFHNIMKASVKSPWGEGMYREDYTASDGNKYAILAEKTVGDQYNVKVIPYQKEGEINKKPEPILHYLRIMSDPRVIIKEAGEIVLEEHLQRIK